MVRTLIWTKTMRYNLAQERILIMEEILDNASGVMDKLEKAFGEGAGIDDLITELEQMQPDIQKLEEYYTGKYWKNDLRLDEEGKLPRDLKRGVLAQDAISDLLDRNKELLARIEEYKKA